MDIRRIAAGVAVAGTLAVGVVGAAQPAVAAPAPAGSQVVETFPLSWEGFFACWDRTGYYTSQPNVLKATCDNGDRIINLVVTYK
jgi:hypothetical protein